MHHHKSSQIITALRVSIPGRAGRAVAKSGEQTVGALISSATSNTQAPNSLRCLCCNDQHRESRHISTRMIVSSARGVYATLYAGVKRQRPSDATHVPLSPQWPLIYGYPPLIIWQTYIDEPGCMHEDVMNDAISAYSRPSQLCFLFAYLLHRVAHSLVNYITYIVEVIPIGCLFIDVFQQNMSCMRQVAWFNKGADGWSPAMVGVFSTELRPTSNRECISFYIARLFLILPWCGLFPVHVRFSHAVVRMQRKLLIL